MNATKEQIEYDLERSKRKEELYKKRTQRCEFAMNKLKEEGFDPVLVSHINSQIKVYDWHFWAYTGKMHHIGFKRNGKRGLDTFIDILKKQNK